LAYAKERSGALVTVVSCKILCSSRVKILPLQMLRKVFSLPAEHEQVPSTQTKIFNKKNVFYKLQKILVFLLLLSKV